MMRRLCALWAVACVGCLGGDENGGGGGSSGSGGGDTGPRATGVPSTWVEYCGEIGELVCQRDTSCAPGSIDSCTLGFMLGCCAESNACASSFGEGVSSEAYEQCVDDTNAAACGAPATASCIALIGGGPVPQSGRPTTLEEACYASCVAQAATNCVGVDTPLGCTSSCVGVADVFPICLQPWIDLNACMADAPLSCDPVNGGASVSTDDCGPEIDAFTTC